MRVKIIGIPPCDRYAILNGLIFEVAEPPEVLISCDSEERLPAEVICSRTELITGGSIKQACETVGLDTQQSILAHLTRSAEKVFGIPKIYCMPVVDES